MPVRTADQVLKTAEEHLRTAKFGLHDLEGADPNRRRPGLLNAIVFGRSATFALQNLKPIVPAFEDWYTAKQAEMRADPLMVYFNKLRTEIQHAAAAPGAVSSLVSLDGGDMQKIARSAPPNAIGFFIGDRNGGSGYDVRMPDGSTERYYINVPPKIAVVKIELEDAPGGRSDAAATVRQYLDKVGVVVADARHRFG